MGGCKKRRRQRKIRDDITAKRKETRQKRHHKYGHSYAKQTTKGKSWFVSKPTDHRGNELVPRTFEDEYALFKKSGGRLGWNPNPNNRLPENPVYLASKSPYGFCVKENIRDLKHK